MNDKGTAARKKNSRLWIEKATAKNKGALHKQLKVPAGKKIPFWQLSAAAKSPDKKKAKRASLALTLRGFH